MASTPEGPPEPDRPTAASVRPVESRDRLAPLDVIRGVALLGILLMNITSFGLPDTAYSDPTTAGGHTGPNLAIYAFNHVLFEGKMRGLFSLLFGAGLILLTSRAESRGAGLELADIYSRRHLWLIAFGVIHAYLIWPGDILYTYGLCGLFAFPFRKLGPGKLAALGLLAMAMLTPMALLEARELSDQKHRAAEAQAVVDSGKEPTEEQRQSLDDWNENLKERKPDADEIREEIAAYQSGYLTHFEKRAEAAFHSQTEGFYLVEVWDSMGMILIGMALMKLGVTSGSRSRSVAAWMTAVGYGIGLPLNAYVTWRLASSSWDPVVESTVDYGTYELRRLAITIGHVGLMLLWVASGRGKWLQSRLGSVGQMALSAYLGTSLICTTLFYGHGFGLFGRLERYQLYAVVLPIWALWLAVCPWWLGRFRYGPMEWLWRSLTYWKPQPMRPKRDSAEPAVLGA